MRDVGASVVTAAMVDAKTFDRSALPGRAAFAEGQRAALERANLRKGEVRYWSVNAYWGGRPRMMLSIESPIAKAVVEIDRQGKVLQVTPA
jgi:hypothetical protein